MPAFIAKNEDRCAFVPPGGDRRASRVRYGGRVYGQWHGTKRVNVDANTPLLWVVREHLKLTGTKFGCGSGLCGACTVHVDGKAVRFCQTTMSEVAGKKVSWHHRIVAENVDAVAAPPRFQATGDHARRVPPGTRRAFSGTCHGRREAPIGRSLDEARPGPSKRASARLCLAQRRISPWTTRPAPSSKPPFIGAWSSICAAAPTCRTST